MLNLLSWLLCIAGIVCFVLAVCIEFHKKLQYKTITFHLSTVICFIGWVCILIGHVVLEFIKQEGLIMITLLVLVFILLIAIAVIVTFIRMFTKLDVDDVKTVITTAFAK